MDNYLNLAQYSTTRSLTKIQADNGARSGGFCSGQAVCESATWTETLWRMRTHLGVTLCQLASNCPSVP